MKYNQSTLGACWRYNKDLAKQELIEEETKHWFGFIVAISLYTFILYLAINY